MNGAPLIALAAAFALGVLALFATGHCLVIAFAGFSSTWVQRWLSWQDDTPGAKWLRRVCGLFVLLAGVWLVIKAG
jgi:cytochrome c-type biogenesis protein